MYRHCVNAAHYTMHILVAGILNLWEESTQILSSTNFDHNFRQLQVREAILNFCVRSKLFPSLLVVAPLIQILMTFACLKYHDAMSVSQLMFLAAGAADTFLVNVIYCTGAGIVHMKSSAYLERMRGVVKGKLGRRLLKSYLTLKVRFGSNFMDERTPLVLQHFCSIQIANLLLLL